MLNFREVPLLKPHPAHLTVQIFAVIKLVVSEAKALAQSLSIRDLDAFIQTQADTLWPPQRHQSNTS